MPLRPLPPRTLVLVFATLAAAAFFVQLWSYLAAVESYYGSARAPHSDALIPWLHGALSYYFHDVPITLLYRPTVGLFYSSLLSSFGGLHIDWLPAFFALFLAGAVIVFFKFARPLLAAPVALWLLFAAATFDQTIAPLEIGTLNVDFLSFAFTVAGVLFLILGFSNTPASVTSGAVAFLLLGLVAAIRGPLMLAGPALLLGAAYLLYRNRQARGIPLLGACFFFPLIVDGAIQRAHGIVSNGLNVCFTFYADPRHTWTASTNALFEQLRPSSAEVFSNYIAFVTSAEGIGVVAAFFTNQLYADAARVVSLPGCVVLTIALIGARSLRLSRAALPAARSLLQNNVLLARAVVPLLLLALAAYAPLGNRVIAVIALAWLFGASIRFRLRSATACFTIYALSLLFLSLLGLAWVPRLSLTIAFCLPLGFYFLLFEPSEEPPRERPRRALFASSLAAAAIVLWLYVGNFVVTTSAKRIHVEQVENRSAAIKISDDPRLDRSLFYTGAKQLLYTRFETAPVGSVLRFQSVTTPAGHPPAPDAAGSNASFIAPVTFAPVGQSQ